MRRARADIEAKWRERLAAMEASGLTARAFAKREGLSVSSLYAWQRKIRLNELPKLLPVVVRETRGRAPVQRCAEFELVVDSRITIRLQSDFDEPALTRLLAVVVR